MTADTNCIFCRIAAGQIPAKKVFEDEELLVFHDINPWAPVHMLVIPRQHIASLAEATAADAALIGRMLVEANGLAVGQGSKDGFRVIINTGRVGNQEVPHLHIHVVGGTDPVGPMLKKL